jgi:ABC-type phosphate/phosphonate transport system substrate-binding protein
MSTPWHRILSSDPALPLLPDPVYSESRYRRYEAFHATRIFFQKQNFASLFTAVFLASAILGGCSDSERVQVDFKKGIDVNSTEKRQSSDELNVAVGSMSSPYETFVHYQALPEYLASKVGRKIQLVQRKTYAEINDLLGSGGIDREYYSRKNFSVASKVRIVYESEPFGNPPLVASVTMSESLRQRFRELLFAMNNDPEGAKILSELLIDRFTVLDEQLYDPIRRMLAQMRLLEEGHASTSKP